VQAAREFGVVDWRAHPQIEAAVGHLGAQRLAHHGQHGAVFLGVEPAVLLDMLLIAPCGDGGSLHRKAHGRAVIGAVKQEFLDELSIAGHEPGAHARRVGALRQAGERHQPLVRATQAMRGLQGAERRLAAVDFRVALVRGNGEAVPVGQLEKLAPLLEPHDTAARIGGRAGIDQLHPGPGFRRSVYGRRAGEQRRPLVDLVERVGTHHSGLPARVDQRLRESEERLARAVDRQHLLFGIGLRDAIAAGEPFRDRLAQLGRPGGERIGGEPIQCRGQGILDQCGCWMLGLADLQIDRAQGRRRGVARDQRAQLLERIGLELGKEWIHRAGLIEAWVRASLSCGARRSPWCKSRRGR